MDGESPRRERKILVAVDGGEESMYALSWCLHNVAAAGDTLVLLYAILPNVVYSALDGTGRDIDPLPPVHLPETGYLFSSDVIVTMERYGRETAESVLEKARRACSGFHDLKVEALAGKGDPRDVICEKAEKLGADLLVMGSHGYGLIKRAFLGSVSNHCAQNVKCPVLIVKRPRQHS